MTTLTDIPASIPRARALEAITSLGLGVDPNEIRGVRFEPERITIVVYAVNDKGSRYFPHDRAGACTYEIEIPITD